jgi:hypothetical protein
MISTPPSRIVAHRIAAPLPASLRPRAPQKSVQPTTPLYKIGQAIGRMLMLLLLLIGLCTVFDNTIGDGPLPHFNSLKTMTSSLIAAAHRNTTARLTHLNSYQAWPALAPSRDLLTALSPEISAWLYDLHRQNRILYTTPTDAYGAYGVTADTPILAAYRHIDGKLYLGQNFWHLSDGQKVAVLAHEYRHSRQNAPKRIGTMLAQLLGGGQLRYASRIEDEAFDYERQAQSALGI